MGVFKDHPHTAITEKIQIIISNSKVTIDTELPLLIELIDYAYTGPEEAARAIRKKLKHGTVSEKKRALILLNDLAANGGKNLQELYNDKELLKRLVLSSKDPEEHGEVRRRIVRYAQVWQDEFAQRPFHTGLAHLADQMPRESKPKRRPKTAAARNNFMSDEPYGSDNEGNSSPTASSSSHNHDNYANNNGNSSVNNSPNHRNRNTTKVKTVDPNVKYRIPQINLQKESPKIKLHIAEAASSSTNLTNSLKSLPPGVRSSDDKKCAALFEETRTIRRKILRYLQSIDSEEFLGSLISSNEALVAALQLYTEKDNDEDSDYSLVTASSDGVSDDDTDNESFVVEDQRKGTGLNIASSSSSRDPGSMKKVKDVEEDDPFGDDKAVDESVAWK